MHETRAARLEDRCFYIQGSNAELIDVPLDRFWGQLMSGEIADAAVGRVAGGDGWLLSRFEMRSDMASWEVHPAGDELIHQLSGRFALVLEQPGGKGRIELGPGDTCVVPRGLWHRFLVREPGCALAITCGKGTQHKPVAAGSSRG